MIVAAFEAEAEARQSDTPAVSHLIKLLVRAGETRANARELAVDFKPELGPYQFLFVKRQSFIKSDQFAKVYDGGSFRDADRPIASVLGVEEASMNSSLLMTAIVQGLRARHIVFVGDENQLPPIGPGRPFADMIAAGNIPTTRLTKNWRTDRQGIQQLCADMLTLDAAELAKRFPDYVKRAAWSLFRVSGANAQARRR